MPSLVTERIESVKAGILSSAVFGVAEIIIVAVHISLQLPLERAFQPWQIDSLIELGLQIAIAFSSGFLFGVTYRYIIRGDRNSHLQDGAVLAFGLVRGFALIEGTEFTPLWLLVVIESIVSFAIARWSLDLALKFKAIEPFI